MFIVIPQFLVTGLSSIIFAIFDPNKSVVLHGHQAENTQLGDGMMTPASEDAARRLLFARSDDDMSQMRPDSIVIIFR